MKTPINWKDQVVENPNTFLEEDVVINGVTYKKHTKFTGEVIQKGTPMNAANFNDMDMGGIEGILIGLNNTDHIRKLEDKTKGLEGERIAVTLTNSQKYPFNNSKKTVSLGTIRNTKDYTVLVEVLSKEGGGVGDIEISDKQTNGFKIAFTGGASSVSVNCIVQGGI